MDEELISTNEICQMFNISREYVRQLGNKGVFVYIRKVGRMKLYTKQSVLIYMNQLNKAKTLGLSSNMAHKELMSFDYLYKKFKVPYTDIKETVKKLDIYCISKDRRWFIINKEEAYLKLKTYIENNYNVPINS